MHARGLLAVIGPSMKEKVCPPRFFSRSFSKIFRASQKRRMRCSNSGWSGFLSIASNMSFLL
jgi:hypothetical protein